MQKSKRLWNLAGAMMVVVAASAARVAAQDPAYLPPPSQPAVNFALTPEPLPAVGAPIVALPPPEPYGSPSYSSTTVSSDTVQQAAVYAPVVQAAPPQPPVPPSAESQPSAINLPEPVDAQPVLSQAQVEQIVADYLTRRDAEKAAKDDGWYAVGTDTAMTAKWNHGLELQSKNKDFKVHVGGRTQFDTSFFNNDPYLEVPGSLGGINGGLGGGASQPLTDSTQFRRARLRVDGQMNEQIQFAFEYEFLNDVSVAGPTTTANALATTVPAATDLWVNFSELPILGNIKVGNQKNPIGMEHLQSSRFLDFIERSFNQDLFYGPFNNGFSPGIMAWDMLLDERATYAAGAFASNMNSGTNIFGYGLGNDYLYSFRGTLLPYYDTDGRYLVHLGGTFEHRAADDGHVRVRTRGNIRNGPPGPFNAVYADTTYLIAESQDLLNLEAATAWGPWMVQSEYCFSWTHDATQTVNVLAPTPRGTVVSHGGYVEVLYFLTGETRGYSKERGAFDRVIPFANSFRVLGNRGCVCQGWGAWQVGIRYDHADLNNAGINGGMLDGITLGLNWFLNPNMKVQFNWDYTHRGDVATATGVTPSGEILGFGTRMAVDF